MKKQARRPAFVDTRKALRKQKRKDKKLHRQEHYLQKRNKDISEFSPGRFVKRPLETVDSDTELQTKKPKLQVPAQNLVERERLKEKKEAQKLKSQIHKQRKNILLEANEEEDKIIKKLEKQLGLNKSKNKNNYFADDGLDYLLEICDKSTTEQIVAAEKQIANAEDESDFEDDLAAVTGKKLEKTKKKNTKGKDKTSEDESEINDEDLSDEFTEDDLGEEEMEGESEIEELEFDGDATEESDFEETDVSDDDGPTEKPAKSTKSKPDTNVTAQKLVNSNAKPNTTSKTNKPKVDKIISENNLSKVFSDDEVSHLSGDDEELDGFSGDDEEPKAKVEEKPDVWEDIYGRKRDKAGNVIKEEKSVYVPPHLRNKNPEENDENILLKKQIKNVLNKITSSNLHWACASVERLYSQHSRHGVNACVAAEWLAGAASGASGGAAGALAEQAAMAAVTHANVGAECGAYLLEELCKRFDSLMRSPQPMADKALDNIVACLSHLYTFKIYNAQLLYDILNRLLQDLTEKHIDCILVALRIVGGVLRKDDPGMLKEFIQDAQGRVAKLQESASGGSRMKFLLEVLLAIKNNNLTKIPNYDPTHTEALRKQIRSIIRKGNYVTALNIRLEDLLKAQERGKWWVVGSAWEGDRPKPEAKPGDSLDSKLLELARKQRINTDVRRNIFCVIMSAEDYMDAFEKLQHLGLRTQQQREVAPVLLACCLQEGTYNPYYAVLAQKLCDIDRKYQLSIQYSIWDKIKELETLTKYNVTNLAQFLVHLILQKGLPLSVLKIIQFSDLNKHTVKFMRQILLAIVMNADFQAALEAFSRVAKPPKLHMFRESLRLFIQHFLVKNAGKKTNILTDEELVTLKNRALEVEKILTMHENKMRL